MAAPVATDDQILLNSYVYMAEHLDTATRAERRAIAAVPLWSGRRWLRQRPIYVVDDAEVARSLAPKLPVWLAPVSPRSLGHLVDALGATVLTDADFVPRVADAERVAGEAIQETFGAAVVHLRDWLARHDSGLYEALDPEWHELVDAQITLAPNLEVELRPSNRGPIRVSARAHVRRPPIEFSFDDEESVGAEEAGGRAIATLFTDGDRDKVALAWAAAWTRALHGDRSQGMRLAEQQQGDVSLDALFDQAAKSGKGRRLPAPKTGNGPRSSGQDVVATDVVSARHLKDIGDLVVASVSRPDGENGGRQRRGSRGLRTDQPSGKPIDPNTRPAPRSAPRAYSPQEQEHLALIALQLAINGELSDLSDFRHVQGVGADAFDRLKRAFEIKSFATTMPDQVTLTANEFKRALEDGKTYHLAVVAGLEEGYETVVRIILDPVHKLAVQRSTSVVLGGVRNADKPIEVRFGDIAGEDGRSDG